MKKQDILKKIGIIITELQEQYDYTSQNQSDLNDLELELFVANAHFLTDHVEILRKLNTQEIKLLPQAGPVTPVIYPGPVAEPKPTDAWMAPENMFKAVTSKPTAIPAGQEIEVYHPIEEKIEPEKVANNELLPEETTDALSSVVDEEPYQQYTEPAAQAEVIEPEYKYEPIIEEPPVKPEPVYYQPEPAHTTTAQPVYEPVINTYQPEDVKPAAPVYDTAVEKPPLTLNELIAAQQTSRTTAQVDHQPIRDLKSAITLNDKLLYVRDLFNGYSMAYSEAIEILNRFGKFSEADQFLKVNYFNKNNWEAKQATADKFYDLLLRRFPV